MRFVVISDTHGFHRDLPRLPKGEVLIHAGDISNMGREAEVKDFLDWFSRQDYKYKIFIAGNHDFLFERFPDVVPSLIPENVIYLEDSSVEIDGIKIYGSPITPFFYNWAFNRRRGLQIKPYWEKIPADTDILITHGPVYGILDKTTGGDLTGCRALQERMKTLHVKFHLCGHIHEAYGKIKKKGTTYINASILNEHYRITNKPVVFSMKTISKLIN